MPCHAGTVDALNVRTKDKAIQKIPNFEVLQELYPTAKPGQPSTGIRNVKVLQHCELTVFLNIMARYKTIRPSNVELRVSKRNCRWCFEWLQLAENSIPTAADGKKFRVIGRATHGKQPDGWALPTTDLPVENQMKNLVLEQVDDILWSVQEKVNEKMSSSPDISGLSGSIDLASISSPELEPKKPKALPRNTTF